MDLLTTFCRDQAITASAKSDILDLKAIYRDIGVGVPLFLALHVTQAFTDAGSDSTVTPSIETDDLEAFGSATPRLVLPVLPALSAVGLPLVIAIGPGIFVERWVRLDFTVAGGNLTTGKITAYLTPDVEIWRGYRTPIGPSF